MKAAEIKALKDADLAAKVAQVKEELFRMKRTHRMSPLENPMRITATRKLVARLTTELHQRKNH
jgi:large subunit ribosomal protein L29